MWQVSGSDLFSTADILQLIGMIVLVVVSHLRHSSEIDILKVKYSTMREMYDALERLGKDNETKLEKKIDQLANKFDELKDAVTTLKAKNEPNS